MKFIKNIQNSIYNPSYYLEIIKAPLKESIKYYLLLALILALARAVLPAIDLATGGSQEINDVFEDVVNVYPEDLVITIDNGQVSTNVEEPYFITLPTYDNSTPVENNLAVIDTQSEFSVQKFNEYSTVLWVTKDSLIMKDSNGKIQIQDLSQVSDVVIERSIINELAMKIQPWLKFLVPGIVLMVFVGMYIFYMINLIYVFFLALFIMILTKLMVKPLNFENSYKVALHAITLSLILGIIFEWIDFQGFAFMGTIISLIVVSLNIHSNKA